MTQQAERNPFFDDAIAAYGREGAQEICETLIESIAGAQVRLPLSRPLSGIRTLIISSGYTHYGFAAPTSGVIEIALSPNASVEHLVNIIPPLVEHEVAHIAHDQINPIFSEQAPKELVLFTALLREGVAIHAARCLNPRYDPSESMLAYDPDEAMPILAELIYDPPSEEVQYRDYYDFLSGNVGFTMTGHELGAFVIYSFIHDKRPSMIQLMSMSVEDYRAYAEDEL
jgi:hypothetical protein